jgi:hypothetical protein
LINVAVVEKVSALRTEEYFAERAAKGDIKKAVQVLKRAGKGNAPVAGDEVPRKATRRRLSARKSSVRSSADSISFQCRAHLRLVAYQNEDRND